MSSIKEFDHLRIALEEIQAATNKFSDENIIGRGGFGKVYKGQLVRCEKSIDVAVSRLDTRYRQGAVEFLTEISNLSPLEHENLISLIGFCEENGEKMIVKKLEVNGSLDKHLSRVSTLTWMQRLHICVGAARALSYLHHNTGRNYSIIHRNIKSSKILLDENWNAKIGDCKLSLVNPAHRRHRLVLSDPAGTLGYVDPVYLKTGSVTYKSDSYSFGVVLLEVLCGRLCRTSDLIPEAQLLYEEGKLDEIIPVELREQMDPESLSIFADTTYHCLNKQRAQRPDMNEIVRKLVKALECQQKPTREEHPIVALRTWSNNLKEKLEHLKIPLENIKSATNDFDEKKCIGSGGYAKVYKAELEYLDLSIQGGDKSEVPKTRNTVAIKRILSRQEGGEGFFIEVKMLTECLHPNVVSLVGFCDEDPELILIYEHASNGSLDDYLESMDYMTNLTWVERLQMCLDIAQGLNYLHTKDKHRIIHRDIKSANILLDHDRRAKIADFGLSKFGPMNDQVSYLQLSEVAGTLVYLDPEYEETGKLKRESDIYSFGVVLFEILCGRLAYDQSYYVGHDKGLPSVVRRCVDEGTLKEIIDPKLIEDADENILTLNRGPNEESLATFLTIACQCLEKKQAKRPTMEVVIRELQKALDSHVNGKDIFKISLNQILLATNDFSDQKLIGKGGFGDVYKGEVVQAHHVAIKRYRAHFGQGEAEFLAELEILFEYKHENVIGLVGYCNDSDEQIIVYEYASHGSLDKYLSDASLTWTKRIKICIDVARGLNFLHGGDRSRERVIHRNIKSGNILLDANWKAKITDFGLSVIAPINEHMNHVIIDPAGTVGYIDKRYSEESILTKESDIYSLGVVLLEIMSGRMVHSVRDNGSRTLVKLYKHRFEEGKADEMVFDGIKAQIVPKSLTVFFEIVHQCLHDKREQRPTAEQVMVQLKEALQLQEYYEKREPILPKDYREIIQQSKSPEINLIDNKWNLYDILGKGILLQIDKVWFSLSVGGMKNEMISATMFSYKNSKSYKWSMTQNSRFPKVAEMLDISDMKIEIKITPHLLSPDVNYGVYVVFKICDPRKLPNKPVYVNLKYKMGMKTLHSYFARWRDGEWMMIELDKFLNHNETSEFEVLLESFSEYCCESGAIFVEGIEFRAIDNVKHGEMEKLKEVETTLELNSNTDQVQQLPIHNDDTIDEKLFSPRKVNDKKCLMLPAIMVLHAYSSLKYFNWISLAESRSEEVAVLQGQQVFRLKCKIETQRLSSDTDYACYLVFKLSQECHGLQCPVKVRDKMQRKNKESKVIYFRSPSLVNVHGMEKIPKQREDGLMEVIVWELKSSDDEVKNDDIPMNLKLKCYEGTLSGLIVCGVEFRPT